MPGRITPLLGGPMLRRELVRAARKPVPRLFWSFYLLGLTLQFIYCFSDYFPNKPHPGRELFGVPIQVLTPLQIWRAEAVARSANAANYVSLLLRQQLLLVLVLTPAAAAGALAYEKETDNLQALFGTDLTAREIVVGKAFGRLGVVLRGALAVFPFLVFGLALAGMPASRAVFALVHAAALVFALTGACLLVSLWAHRASDAILACYASLVLIYFAGQIALTSARIPAELDPLAVADELAAPHAAMRPVGFVLHLAFWVAAGAACLAVAASRLHPAFRRESDPRRRVWLWKLRPPVGDDPVRWREQHLLGLAPLPLLQRIPRWMGLACTFAFAAALALEGLDWATKKQLLPELRYAQFAAAWRAVHILEDGRLEEGVHLMGAFLFVMGTFIVGVRCAGSIAEEKRRKTWEDLLMTALTLDEIVAGKWQGVVRATVPYLVVYAVPLFAYSAFLGGEGVLLAAAWAGGTFGGILAAAGLGVAVAARPEREQSSERDATAFLTDATYVSPRATAGPAAGPRAPEARDLAG